MYVQVCSLVCAWCSVASCVVCVEGACVSVQGCVCQQEQRQTRRQTDDEANDGERTNGEREVSETRKSNAVDNTHTPSSQRHTHHTTPTPVHPPHSLRTPTQHATPTTNTHPTQTDNHNPKRSEHTCCTNETYLRINKSIPNKHNKTFLRINR